MHLQSLQVAGIAFVGVALAQTHHIEIHTAYAAPIEGHTRYLTEEGGTTRLVSGVDTDYISSITRTTDSGNPESTVVVGVEVAVDQKDGDTVVTLADALKQEADRVMKAALEHCQRQSKLRKRDVDAECYMAELTKAAKDPNFLKLEDESQMESFNIEVHSQAPGIIQSASSELSGKKEKNKFAILAAMSLVAGVDLITGALPAELAGTPWNIKFNDDEFGGPPEEEAEEGEDEEEEDDDDDDSPPEETNTDPTNTGTSTSTATATGCGPDATIHEDSPACDDSDCGGRDGKCAKDGSIKGCPCAEWATAYIDTDWDPDWRDFQQEYLGDLIENGPDVLPPTCFRNTHGNNFEGKPKAEPSAWCVCSSVGDNTFSSGMYATMTGTGNDACTYTTMPTSQVTISVQTNTASEVTSCRWEDEFDLGEEYCTCNDDKMHGSTVTTVDGTKTTVCPDFARQTDNNDDEQSEDKAWMKIVAEDVWDNHNLKRTWKFYAVTQNRNVVCATDISPLGGNYHETDDRDAPRGRLWPSGTFKVYPAWTTHGDECEYKNDGYQDGDDLSKAGTLECDNKSYKCKDNRQTIDDGDHGFKRCDEYSDWLELDIYESEVIVCEST